MPDTLQGWLGHIERQHSQGIALGLDRVQAVKSRLGQRQSCPVITVGGTNGKGSTCAMLESILRHAGYRVGLYTSPHLLSYNERVRIDGAPVGDAVLCEGFARVEAERRDIPLTYFEFGTLAAWEIFAGQALDAIVLEVGLGGRLDAVNAYDADCAVLTNIALDHMDYLGPTRAHIGFEKAGIFRTARPAICGDADPPATLLEHAFQIGADLKRMGREFGYVRQELQWQYWSWLGQRAGLAFPALRGKNQLANASCALAALDAVHSTLPVAMQDVRRGLLEFELPARFQVLPGRPAIVLDVAHNPDAAVVLADNLGNMAFHPETYAVFGMLADKDIAGVVRALKGRITQWLPCTLSGPRGTSAARIAEILKGEGMGDTFTCFDDPASAIAFARARASEDDRIVAFGSFHTVADVMRGLQRVA